MLDPILTKLLKEMLPDVIDPLLNIINVSLSLYVPKTFKLAMIKPLVKKPQLDHTKLVNYRPISNLPFLSKTLEKAFTHNCVEEIISASIFSQDLDRTIVPRQLSSESQMICSFYPIVVVSLY